MDSTFLLVFDNADDLAALKTAWPAAIHGSVLLTTRNFIVATSLATKYVLVDALSDEDGSRLLLKAVDHDNSSPDAQQQQQQAITITKTFGGPPLALTQIGGFIKQRKMSLNDIIRSTGKIRYFFTNM